MKETIKEIWKGTPSPMKWLLFVLLMMCFLGGIYGCGWVKSYKPDNPAEEKVEAVLKDITGEDIDLSPSTPET